MTPGLPANRNGRLLPVVRHAGRRYRTGAANGGHDTEVRFTHARNIPLFISGLRATASGPVMVEKTDSLIGGREDGQSTLLRSRLSWVKRTSVS